MLLEILIKLNTYFKSTKATPKLKAGVYFRNADKRNIFSKGKTSYWNRELLNVNKVLKTQSPTFRIGDINGEIIESKYYEQELLKSEFDFESNNNFLQSLHIDLLSATKQIKIVVGSPIDLMSAIN